MNCRPSDHVGTQFRTSSAPPLIPSTAVTQPHRRLSSHLCKLHTLPFNSSSLSLSLPIHPKSPPVGPLPSSPLRRRCFRDRLRLPCPLAPSATSPSPGTAQTARGTTPSSPLSTLRLHRQPHPLRLLSAHPHNSPRTLLSSSPLRSLDSNPRSACGPPPTTHNAVQ